MQETSTKTGVQKTFADYEKLSNQQLVNEANAIWENVNLPPEARQQLGPVIGAFAVRIGGDPTEFDAPSSSHS